MKNDLKYESNIENNKKILNNNIDLFYKGDISMKSFGEFSAKSIAPNEAFATQQAIATLIQTEFEKMINSQLIQPINSMASLGYKKFALLFYGSILQGCRQRRRS